LKYTEVKYTDYQKTVYLNLLQTLNQAFEKCESLTENEISWFKSALPDFLSSLPINIESVSRFSNPFERLVINRDVVEIKQNQRLTSLEQIRYPPLNIQEELDYNRASLKGQSIFYAGSLGSLPVTIEVNPQVGDLVTLSKWNLKDNKKLDLVAIFQDLDIALSNPNELLPAYNNYIEFLGSLDSNTRVVVEESYKFIVKAFRRKVSPSNKRGYVFSSLISDMLFTKLNHNVDAIYYPIVPNDASAMNIAIKPSVLDEKFDFIDATEEIFSVAPNSGGKGWLAHVTATCDSYNKENLELEWKEQFIDDNKTIQRLIQEHNISL